MAELGDIAELLLGLGSSMATGGGLSAEIAGEFAVGMGVSAIREVFDRHQARSDNPEIHDQCRELLTTLNQQLGLLQKRLQHGSSSASSSSSGAKAALQSLDEQLQQAAQELEGLMSDPRWWRRNNLVGARYVREKLEELNNQISRMFQSAMFITSLHVNLDTASKVDELSALLSKVVGELQMQQGELKAALDAKLPELLAAAAAGAQGGASSSSSRAPGGCTESHTGDPASSSSSSSNCCAGDAVSSSSRSCGCPANTTGRCLHSSSCSRCRAAEAARSDWASSSRGVTRSITFNSTGINATKYTSGGSNRSSSSSRARRQSWAEGLPPSQQGVGCGPAGSAAGEKASGKSVRRSISTSSFRSANSSSSTGSQVKDQSSKKGVLGRMSYMFKFDLDKC